MIHPTQCAPHIEYLYTTFQYDSPSIYTTYAAIWLLVYVYTAPDARIKAPALLPLSSSDTMKEPSAWPCAPPIPWDSSHARCTASTLRPCGSFSKSWVSAHFVRR